MLPERGKHPSALWPLFPLRDLCDKNCLSTERCGSMTVSVLIGRRTPLRAGSRNLGRTAARGGKKCWVKDARRGRLVFIFYPPIFYLRFVSVFAVTPKAKPCWLTDAKR